MVYIYHGLSEYSAGFYQTLRLLNGFMLNSAEHEICPVIKSQIIVTCKCFLAKHS